MGRRALNHAVNRMRREDQRRERIHVITGLDAPCADPACGHELGFHRFVTFTLPTPCQVEGCRCRDFLKEPPMLNPHDPFAGMAEPPASPFGDLGEPEPPEVDVASMTAIADVARTFPDANSRQDVTVVDYAALSAPVGAPLADEASTPVRFPVLTAGVKSIPFADLVGPAQRVADIVEALEPVLAPPAVVQQLEKLVTQANALVVTDADSYKRGQDLYELLAANEKGIEEGEIGNVVRFFHRPWKAFCDFRARHLKPVTEAKKRLSDVCGAWKLEDDKRAAAEARRMADEAAAAERERLREIAEAATAAAAAAPAESPVREVLEQTAAQATEQQKHVAPIYGLPSPRAAGNGKTKGRKTYEAVIVDPDAFYKALAEDSTRRVAAPFDMAYLHKQACDLQDEISKRFPGVECREKGGLTAGGRR